MKHEKEYIDYLVKESKKNKLIEPLLDDYFITDDFQSVLDGHNPELNVESYNVFVKNISIDSLLG